MARHFFGRGKGEKSTYSPSISPRFSKPQTRHHRRMKTSHDKAVFKNTTKKLVKLKAWRGPRGSSPPTEKVSCQKNRCFRASLGDVTACWGGGLWRVENKKKKKLVSVAQKKCHMTIRIGVAFGGLTCAVPA